MFRAKSRAVAVVVACIVIGSTLIGCGGAVMAALRVAGALALVPDEWSSHGGIVRIIADVVGGSSISKVIAHILKPGTTQTTIVILTRTAEGKYEGEFKAPANTDSTAPAEYTAVIEATDVSGNTATSEPVPVEVPAVDASTH